MRLLAGLATLAALAAHLWIGILVCLVLVVAIVLVVGTVISHLYMYNTFLLRIVQGPLTHCSGSDARLTHRSGSAKAVPLRGSRIAQPKI